MSVGIDACAPSPVIILHEAASALTVALPLCPCPVITGHRIHLRVFALRSSSTLRVPVSGCETDKRGSSQHYRYSES